MEILVITFSRGLNPGTYMQAYGVKTALLKIYPNSNISYLNFPDFKWNRGNHNKRDSWLNIFLQKSYAFYRLLRYRNLEKKTFNYTRKIDLFNYEEADAKRLLSKYDMVVVGSDTILEKAISDDGKRFGLNWISNSLLDKPHLFFAASASPANFSDNRYVIDNLKFHADKFKFIGLRDDLTIKLFEEKLNILDTRIIKQPDPSYYLDIYNFKLPDSYIRKIESLKAKNGKICLYNFSSNFPYRKDLILKLKSKGYFVITSVYNPSADLCIDTIIPTEWAGIFKFCDLVVTERFHDSLFALRNGVPVVAVDWESDRFNSNNDSKTFRILQDYGLEKYHFILRSKDQIDNIVASIDSLIDQDFVKETILFKAKAYEKRAMDILQIIKESV